MKKITLIFAAISLLSYIMFTSASCAVEEDSITPSDEVIDITWEYTSDGKNGTIIFNANGTYVNTYDGTPFNGNWSWVDEEERIMKVNEVEFDGTTYSTYYRFNTVESDEMDVEYVQIEGDEKPDENSNWQFNFTLNKE